MDSNAANHTSSASSRDLNFRNGRITLVGTGSSRNQANLSEEMKKHINSSVNYNFALVGFSFLKIITSASILGFANDLCNKPFINITYYMIAHDISYICGLLMKIRTIITGIFAFVPENQDENDDVQNAQNMYREQLTNFVPQVQTGEYLFHISDEAEKKSKSVYAISTLSKAAYFLLFAYEQIIYFNSNLTCQENGQAIRNLVMFYIVAGYVYIGLPLIFLIVTGVCLPFLLVWMYFHPKSDQIPMDEEFMKKLSVTCFQDSLPGNNECSICIADYIVGDKVIQLKCSPMHHFHEDCLKKWFKINGLCPVCRCNIVKQSKPVE